MNNSVCITSEKVRPPNVTEFMQTLKTLDATPNYRPPWWLFNGHLQTIFPSVGRKIKDIQYRRERIETDDGDFLDLDWSAAPKESKRLAVLCHGLEGHSMRSYMLGMARAMNQGNIDAVAFNYRSCSGIPNRLPRFYHNGATDDLERVLVHIAQHCDYDEIVLIGFSLGGNLILNYLSQNAGETPSTLTKAVVFSVPLHIATSAAAIALPSNRIYMRRFLKDLKQKILAKEKMFPSIVTSENYDKIVNFKQFDDRYTAPLHGFENAEDYWQKCSGLWALPQIQIPTLIVNAQNDPFLTSESFPSLPDSGENKVRLITPQHGGHCGFPQKHPNGHYWSEQVALDFLK